MIKNPYSVTYNSTPFYYVASGPGTHIKSESEYQATVIAAALNNAYLLGRLQYLESRFPDVEIPVNTVGPEVGSN